MNRKGLFLLLLVGNIKLLIGQEVARNEETAMFRLETVAGTEVCVSNRSNVALMVSNGIACGACHTVLEEAIRALDTTFSVIVGVVTLSKRSVSRRESVQWVARLVDTPEILLLYPSEYSNGCETNIQLDTASESPYLVLIRNDRPTLTCRYHELFLSTDSAIPSAEQVARRITEVINGSK